MSLTHLTHAADRARATQLYADPFEGTYVDFLDQVRRPYAADTDPELVITVAAPPFGKLTMRLDLDEADRLLAVVDTAVHPAEDLAEHFGFVHHCQRKPAVRAAEAFIKSSGSLAETIRFSV